MHKLQVGQQLWHVPLIGARGASFVTVSKVGRKWADLSNGQRIELATLFIDQGEDGQYRGRCYLSRADWSSETYRRDLWRGLTRRLRDRPSPKDSVSVRDIEQAAGLLGIDLFDILPPFEPGVTDAG